VNAVKPTRTKMLTFRSGGWVLLLAAVLTLGAAAWQVAPVLLGRAARARGDGKNPSSYGFDLRTTLVPASRIVASGVAKDSILAMTGPGHLTTDEADSYVMGRRGRYLVPDDRVIGVALGGESRAYPLRILNWHEVVNDTLGGVPIAVTYHPLTEGVVVFDRRSGGEVLEFGVSGLLFNSNLLMYDRRPQEAGESLWSQLQARAVAGPGASASLRLTVLPCSLTTWDHWRRAHPDTTVLAPRRGMSERYERNPYGSYFNTDRLMYPVDPLPPAGRLSLKTRILAVPDGGGFRLTPVDAGSAGTEDTTATSPAFYAFWFAWYAMHPDAPGDLVDPS
jgi:hypothetical protein